nr:DUF2061 domain-containing protein [Halegenticoccus soli]
MRVLTKTILYRAVTLAVTFAVAYYLLGDTSTALNIGLASMFLKTVVYFFYERLWDHITWGMSPA